MFQLLKCLPVLQNEDMTLHSIILAAKQLIIPN